MFESIKSMVLENPKPVKITLIAVGVVAGLAGIAFVAKSMGFFDEVIEVSQEIAEAVVETA